MTYSYVDVKHELVTQLQPLLSAEGYEAIRVIKGDPRAPTEIPCIGINRAGDDETQQVLGEDFGSEYDKSTGKWAEFRGTYFNETVEIRVWHTNADERDKLYTLTKILLFKIRPQLVERGLRNLVLRGGRDEQDNTYPPYPLYWGTITMNYLNPLEVEILYDSVESVDVLGSLSAEFRSDIDLTD